MITPHDARHLWATPLLEWFREVKLAYEHEPLDTCRIANAEDERSIAALADEAIEMMQTDGNGRSVYSILDIIEQIEVRMDDIATRRRVS